MGIPLGLDYSWFVIFVLLTWLLADNYYPAEFKDWPAALYWGHGDSDGPFVLLEYSAP